MNTKILRVIVGLSIVILFSTTKVNAGLIDWVTGPDEDRADNFLFDGSLDLPQLGDIKLPTIQGNEIPNEEPKKIATKPIKARYTVSVSAYSSTPDQTDDSPFITARNTYVRDGIVATNFLPFGTAIKIPDIYGDKIFIVEDRMNKRYWTNVDIWMADRQAALQFGRRNLTIEVL